MRISDWSSDVCASDLGDHLADPAHRLAVRRDNRERTEIVEDILGGDRLLADTAFGEGEILGDRRIEMMADHQHVEMFVDRVDRERTGGVGRRGDDVGRSEEHTSELQSLMRISYAVFCLKKKK